MTRFVSSQVHYKRMETMEKRPEAKHSGGDEESGEIYGRGSRTMTTRYSSTVPLEGVTAAMESEFVY